MNFRTLLRWFLLVGGIVYLGYGVLEASMLDVGIGALAAVVGAIGLWMERREQAAPRGEEPDG